MCMYVCTVCMYLNALYTYVCLYVCIYVYNEISRCNTLVCMYVCMYVAREKYSMTALT